MEISYRLAEEKDFDRVYELMKEFAEYINISEPLLTTPEQMKQDKSIFNCLLMETEGDIAGFATYFFAYYSWTGKSLYLDDLYVREKYRGRGLGSGLFDHLVAIAKNEQCKKMKWQVAKNNEAAIAFYKQRNAVVDDTDVICNLMLDKI